mmetsp:Transcript_37154/g.61535  ORF Transcript_37154/g.61535 Transcript_37154/m.61535 type:complete len:289 (-) Transcript_37154:254-1120(-)
MLSASELVDLADYVTQSDEEIGELEDDELAELEEAGAVLEAEGSLREPDDNEFLRAASPTFLVSTLLPEMHQMLEAPNDTSMQVKRRQPSRRFVNKIAIQGVWRSQRALGGGGSSSGLRPGSSGGGSSSSSGSHSTIFSACGMSVTDAHRRMQRRRERALFGVIAAMRSRTPFGPLQTEACGVIRRLAREGLHQAALDADALPAVVNVFRAHKGNASALVEACRALHQLIGASDALAAQAIAVWDGLPEAVADSAAAGFPFAAETATWLSRAVFQSSPFAASRSEEVE